MNSKIIGLLLFSTILLVAAGCSHVANTVPAEPATETGKPPVSGNETTVPSKDTPVPAADKTGKDVIDRSGRGLTEFPSDVLDQRDVRVLRLSDNRIASLPSQIGRLTEVEEFYLDGNRLTGALPGEIRMMSGLKILDASRNQLTGIPAEIGQLSDLETLDLSDNGIDTYPNEIGNLKGLKTLDLSGNKFRPGTLDEIERLLPDTRVVR